MTHVDKQLLNRVNISDLGLDLAAGEIRDVQFVLKFGENPDIDSGATEDVWDSGGTYTYTAAGGAIHYVSSSDDTDDQIIEVIGLDENFDPLTVNVTLNGQTKTQIGTGEKFIRVFRMKNVGTTGMAGTVYCYEDDTVSSGVPDTATKIRARINNGNNQTLMALYTIRAGYTGFLIQWYCGVSGSVNADMVIEVFVRPFGGVFQIKRKIALKLNANSTWIYAFKIPLSIDEKSDIKVVATSGTNNAAVSAGFDIVEIDNKLLT